RRHTRSKRDWSSDVCSSDLLGVLLVKADAVLAEGFHQGVLEALGGRVQRLVGLLLADADGVAGRGGVPARGAFGGFGLGGGLGRSEEHTSELQSRFDLVCRL